MPSWDDEYSSPSLLDDVTAMDFCPETCEDPTFAGLATGCGEVCRVHGLTPLQCVAFEGTDIGRRFFMCQVQNQVNNCGFVGWVDGDWPETLQNAVTKLWGMYHAENSGRIENQIEIAKLAEEKKKHEEKYLRLNYDVKKFCENTEKRVHEANYKKIMEEGAKEDALEDAKKEVEVLRNEVAILKNVQKSQAEVMKSKQKTWDEEKEALMGKKKKVEYMLFDMLKVSEANIDKLKRIKAISDE